MSGFDLVVVDFFGSLNRAFLGVVTAEMDGGVGQAARAGEKKGKKKRRVGAMEEEEGNDPADRKGKKKKKRSES